MSGYAELIGKDNSTVGKLVNAARVAEKVGNVSNVLIDKVFHLSAIHALPAECWAGAVQIMLDKAWSGMVAAKLATAEILAILWQRIRRRKRMLLIK